MKISNKLNKRNVIGILMCILALLVGIVYYGRIHYAFIPNGEDLHTAWTYFVHGKYNGGNFLWNIITKISYQIFGLSYDSIHLVFIILNALVLILTLPLCLKGKDNKWNYYVLPLFAFFMIFVHTIKADSEFGLLYPSTDMIYMLPYDYHSMPRIYGLLCMVMICIFMKIKSIKVKIPFAIVLVLTIAYASLRTDMIYYVVFLGPLVIALFLRGLRDDKWKKTCVLIVFIGFILFFVSRLLPISIAERLWDDTRADVYGSVYGATNFVNMYYLETTIFNYLDVVLQIFNINLQLHPMLSFWVIVYIVKLAILIIGYVLIFKIIRSSINGTTDKNGYDLIDEIAAWGYVMLSCIFIFSDIGKYTSNMRYMTQLVPLMTIIICRNLKLAMPTVVYEFLADIKYKKALFFVAVGMLCVCYAEPVWCYEATDSYGEDLEAIVEYMKENEIEYAWAPHWLFARLTMLSDGDIIFYQTQNEIKKKYGEDEQIKCIITSIDYENVANEFNNIVGVESYDELCEKYGAPSKILELDNINLYVYDEN